MCIKIDNSDNKVHNDQESENDIIFRDYINYLNILGHYSGMTIKKIRYYLLDFLKFLEERVLFLYEVIPSHMEAYRNVLDTQGKMCDASYNDRIFTLHRFYEYVKVKTTLERNPVNLHWLLEKIKMTQVTQAMDVSIRDELIRKKEIFSLKIYLMLLLLLMVGLTKKETFNLQVAELGWQNRGFLKLKDGLEVRYVPIPDMIFLLLARYIIDNHFHEYDYIFKNAKDNLYTAASFRSYLMDLCARNHIGNGEYVLKGSGYRVLIAREMYEMGVDPAVIRQYFGYKYIETVYRQIDYYGKQVEKASLQYFENNSLVNEFMRGKFHE